MASRASKTFRWDNALVGKIIVGLTKQDNECRTIAQIDARDAQRYIEEQLLRYFSNGSTRIRGRGIWRCKRSNVEPVIVREESVVVEVIGILPYDTREKFATACITFAQKLAKHFKQDACLVQIVTPTGRPCVAFVPSYGRGANSLYACATSMQNEPAPPRR